MAGSGAHREGRRVYSIADYLWMLADETRTSAYASAVRAVVRPGDRVLDVGTGFGFFSVIAARAGAGHVDAVDINPAIHLGARIAAANGCSDRITFHHADVEQVSLPEKADVVISDLRGPTPFAARSLAAMLDVRRRLLRAGGVVIPIRDTLFVAPSRRPAAIDRDVHAAFGREGIVTSPIERIVRDTPYRCSIAPEDLVAEGQPWSEIEYARLERVDADGAAQWTFPAPETVTGLAIWFETMLAPGIGFSSAPGSATRVYQQIYLPLRDAVAVTQGERLRVQLSVRLAAGEYLWAWTLWVAPSAGGPEREVARQNSLAEGVLDPARLRQQAKSAAGV